MPFDKNARTTHKSAVLHKAKTAARDMEPLLIYLPMKPPTILLYFGEPVHGSRGMKSVRSWIWDRHRQQDSPFALEGLRFYGISIALLLKEKAVNITNDLSSRNDGIGSCMTIWGAIPERHSRALA